MSTLDLKRAAFHATVQIYLSKIDDEHVDVALAYYLVQTKDPVIYTDGEWIQTTLAKVKSWSPQHRHWWDSFLRRNA